MMMRPGSALPGSARSASSRAASSLGGFNFFPFGTEESVDESDAAKNAQNSQAESPTDAQLVLLCLDYLRSIRRARSTARNDLEIELGINQDYVTLAIWALSKSFTRPPELSHGEIEDLEQCVEPHEFGNDPFFQPELAQMTDVAKAERARTFTLSDAVAVPSLKVMESEILYDVNPKASSSVSELRQEPSADSLMSGASSSSSPNPHRTSWYQYEDEHYSNQHRFYGTMGLSSKLPLTLPQIVSSGIVAMNAKSRLQAEEEMMSDKLFANFVDAVSKNGFFQISEKEIMEQTDGKPTSDDEIIAISNKIHEERFRKVIAKFRTKLSAKYEEDEKEMKEMVEEMNEMGKEDRDSRHPINVDSFQVIVEEDQPEQADDKGDGAYEPNQGHQDQADDDATLMPDSVFGDLGSNDTEPDAPSLNKNQGSQETTETLDDEDEGTLVAASVFADIASVQQAPSNNVNQKDLEDAERFKAWGNASMQKKKYEKAKNYYTKALELVPTGPTSHVYFSNRAAALLSMRNFNEAVWDAERSIALKPDYPKAHARLGLAHFLLERYQDAVDSYSLAVQFDPKNKNSALYLEKSKKKLASLEKEAAEEEERIVTAQNNNKPVLSRDASEDGERSGQVQDSDGELSVRRDRSGKSTFKERDSRRHVSGGDPPVDKRSLSPSKQSLESLKSRLQKVKQASPERIRSLSEEELVRKDPPVFNMGSDISTHNSDEQDEADRLKGEGNKAMARKEYEKAVRYYSKSLRLAPAGPNSHVYFSNRAAALCYLERYEEAELDAERSLALNPEYGKAHARLGLSRYFLRDYYGAVEAYESALQFDPNNAASKSYLAKAKSKIGRRNTSSSAVYVE